MNIKNFELIITQATNYNTDMFLFYAEGGDRYTCSTIMTLLDFSGVSGTASSIINVRLTSDADTSGSIVSDGPPFDQNIASFIIQDGWPRPVPDIGGLDPWQDHLSFQVANNQPMGIPSRGRNVYLRIVQPFTLPDPNAEYSIRLGLTFVRNDS